MTNAQQKNSPMLKVAGLWAKTSGKGGQYLTGRLGGVKVLILENRDPEPDGPTHSLFFVEAPDRRQGRRSGRRSVLEVRGLQNPPRTPQTPSVAHRSGFPGHRDRVPDHQAPLDHDMPDAPEWAR